MFSLVTVFTAMGLHLQSISYIDNREFPGAGDTVLPGPFGYQLFVYSKPISIIPGAMFPLIQWLADGLLVRSVPNSITWVYNAGCSSSSTVVMPYTA